MIADESTIRRISTVLDVVTRLFVLNVLFKLSATNLLRPTWSLNPLHVPIVSKTILVLYTPHLPGGLA